MIRPRLSPTIFAIAGAPASGKTSFIASAIKKGLLPAHTYILDCDTIMESIDGYQQQLKSEGPAAAFKIWEMPARELAAEKLKFLIENKEDIIYERSCALPDSYDFIKQQVKNNGYNLIMYLLYVTPQEAHARAIVRESLINRHTPAEIISERLKMLSSLWPHYLQLCIEAFMFDNSGAAHELIAHYQNNELLVQHHETYNKFIAYSK